MTSHRLLSISSPRRHRLLAAVALVSYVFCVVGYPVPVLSVARHDATPYPCQDHACGCESAAQCWESCCCFTPAERLAWARRHGVALPAAVAARLAESAAEQHEHASQSCCREAHDDHEHHDAAGSCGHCSGGSCGDDHPAAADHDQAGVRWINAVAAQKCQGLTTLWLSSGANLPVEIRTLWEYDWSPAGSVVATCDQFISHATSPPVPPPRV